MSRIRVSLTGGAVTIHAAGSATVDAADLDDLIEQLRRARAEVPGPVTMERRVRLDGETMRRAVRLADKGREGYYVSYPDDARGTVTRDPAEALERYAAAIERAIADRDYDGLSDETVRAARAEITRADDDAQRLTGTP